MILTISTHYILFISCRNVVYLHTTDQVVMIILKLTRKFSTKAPFVIYQMSTPSKLISVCFHGLKLPELCGIFFSVVICKGHSLETTFVNW